MIQIQLSYATVEEAQKALALLAPKKSAKSKQRTPVDPATIPVAVPAVPADMVAHSTVPVAPVTVPVAPVTVPVAPVTVPVAPVTVAPTPESINLAMKAAAAKVGDAGASCHAIIKEVGGDVGLAKMTPDQLVVVLDKVQAL